MDDDDFFDWGEGEPVAPDSAVGRLLRDYAAAKMFDPSLPGCLIAGRVLCQIPDSDVKYRSFLDWWFAVGRKSPEITTDGWGTVSGPHATRGQRDVIPAEDWEGLVESERQAIRKWAEKIEIALFYD